MPALGVLRVARKLRRAAALPAEERRLSLLALRSAVLVEASLRCLPLPSALRLLGVELAYERGLRLDAASSQPTLVGIEAYHRSVDRAFQIVVWKGTCLRRALTLGHLLRAKRPKLRIGIRSAGAAIEAHAWLDLPMESARQAEPDLRERCWRTVGVFHPNGAQ